MKKALVFLTLTACLFAGCSRTETTTTDSAAEQLTEATVILKPTEPDLSDEPGIRLEGSEMEELTNGAVLSFQVGPGAYVGAIPMGRDLLMFTEENGTVLTKLAGENLVPVAQKTLNCTLDPDNPSVRAQEDGVVYYDQNQNSIFVLNERLEEKAELQMPEDLEGIPLLSSDHTLVYYSCDGNVQVLDLKTGISRMLRQTEYKKIMLKGLYSDGTILAMEGEKDSGEKTRILLSAKNGETLYDTTRESSLVIGENNYFLQYSLGSVKQLVYGSADVAPRSLVPAESSYDAVPVPAWDGYLTISRTGDGTMLSYYDLENGYRTACVTLPSGCRPEKFAASGDGTTIYFSDKENPAVLYGWKTAQTPTGEKKDYSGQWHTAENPDVENLKGCAQLAQKLSDSYQVNLKIWQDALLVDSAVAEHQVPAYRRDLKVLENAMARLPEGFLKKLAAGTDSGRLNIALVRSVDGAEQEGGIQYWQDGDAYLILEMGDTLETAFYHGICHMIDNRVFGTSTLFDDWDDLNPRDFSYDNSYEMTAQRDEYLQDDSRAFIDRYSMTFAKEDRARIFETAMMAGKEQFFSTETMQEKLELLCRGIRRAFDMKDLNETLPWEVYLKEPLFQAD